MTILNSDHFHWVDSLALTAITASYLGTFVLLRSPKETLHRIFFFFNLSIAIWSGGVIPSITTLDNDTATFFFRLCHVGVVFIPTLYLHFTLALTRSNTLFNQRLLKLGYFLSLVFLSCLPTSLMLKGTSQKFHYFTYVGDLGPVYPIHFAMFVSLVLYSMWLLWKASQKSAEPVKSQAKWFFVASLIGYVGGAPNYAPIFNIDLYPYMPFCTYGVAIYSALTTYAIFRHEFLGIKVAIKKTIVYSVLVAFVTCTYLGVVWIVEKIFQVAMGYRSLWVGLGAACIIGVLFEPIRRAIQSLLDRIFFHGTQVQLAERVQRYQEEVKRSEQLTIAATLVAGMAHEIRNPLMTIKTALECLPRKLSDPEFVTSHCQRVSQEVDRINQIIKDVLQFARPQSPQRQMVDLCQLIDDTTHLLVGQCLQKQIELKSVYRDRPIRANVDPHQMKQVLLNLCLNAMDAMNSSNGTITVSIGRNSGDHVEISVQDTGPGISPDKLRHLFEPFFTTKTHGTGLGLSIVHSIVKDHNGTIDVSSNEGRGTVFTIRFPMNK